MVAENVPPVAQEQVGVPEATVADWRDLVESQGDENAAAAGRVCNLAYFRPVHPQTAGRESAEKIMVFDGGLQGAPERKGRYVGLREDDELSPVAGGLRDEGAGLFQRGVLVEEHRGHMSGSHLVRWRLHGEWASPSRSLQPGRQPLENRVREAIQPGRSLRRGVDHSSSPYCRNISAILFGSRSPRWINIR